jgi:hypothetical protein
VERLRFGLIVTGDAEAEFLPKLFRSIMAAAACDFLVIRKSDQLSPVTSEKRKIRMVGRGQVIPTIDLSRDRVPRDMALTRRQWWPRLLDEPETRNRSEKVAVGCPATVGSHGQSGQIGCVVVD